MNRLLSRCCFALATLGLLLGTSRADENDIRKAVTFYASFDESLKADVGGGQRMPDTRFNHPTEKGQYVVEKGADEKVFTIAKTKGIAGGALDAVGVLDKNGRIFYPAKGNIAFKKDGWSGSVSMWCKTDPDKLLKTKFCDPVQITQKGANNGGLWFDFNDAKPRDLRHGAFPMIPDGQKGIGEDDPKAPMVRVPGIGWKADDWHHVVLTFANLDTGKPNAVTALYIDGKLIGEVKDRAIAMGWDIEKAGIYTSINYIGLLDEMALFDRALTAEEVTLLHKKPDLLSPLKKKAAPEKPPAPVGAAPAAPKFPFDAATAAKYQSDYAKWLGLPVEFTNELGMTFVLVPPGTFLMGTPEDELGHKGAEYAEGPRHEVTLTRPFYLGKDEVTVGQFRAFVEATKYTTDGEKNGGGNAHDEKAVWKHRPGTSWKKPGYAGPFSMRDDHPVVHVSHTDAMAFCAWLKERGKAKSFAYGLPTEAQWEWACRAGSGAAYWWGADEDTTGKVANVGDRTLKKVQPEWPRVVMPMDDGHAFPAPVGSYRENAFGLHDMLGNVWEFCGTRFGPYPKEAVTDPVDGDPKRGFAVRGGGWSNAPKDVRCGGRNADPPHFCHSNLGFRVAIPIEAKRVPTADEVLQGLKEFYRKTARPDGSFQPGIDPDYRGMSDAAYSDLAAVTYAVTVSKTFGWKLPHEEKTAEFLLARQKPNGDFFNVAGTVDPASPEGRTYNTTQGLVALHALGRKPRHNPLPVFEDILKADYRQLPAYSTSFFPLAYLCAGQPIPEKADRGIRALIVQDDTGYSNSHVAATFHASHYYRLVGEAPPKGREMVARILRDQKPNGSWLLNMPARDRHATFDAVFTLRHEGGDTPEVRAAIAKAAAWALSCRNDDGGFGHYPGSTSDADAIYFHVGTLVMAGVLKPADPLPPDAHLLSWGHLLPVGKKGANDPLLALAVPDWVGGVAFNPDGDRLAVGSGDGIARIFDAKNGREVVKCEGHEDIVAAVAFHPEGKLLATGSYDHNAAIWDVNSGKRLHKLVGHRGAVMAVAFSPDKSTLATGSIDGTIKLWEVATGTLKKTLTTHKSWVNSLAFRSNGDWLISGSSDGTVIVWSTKNWEPLRTLDATKAEVRSVAISHDGTRIAAGLRYGTVKIWDTAEWKEPISIPGQGDMCAVAFSPSGKFLATTEGDWNRGGFVKIRDAATGNLLTRFQHTGEVISLSFGKTDDVIAAGAADKTVKAWKVPATR